MFRRFTLVEVPMPDSFLEAKELFGPEKSAAGSMTLIGLNLSVIEFPKALLPNFS